MNTDLSILSAEALTMSSREIAELTGKQHKHVMRDIRIMSEELAGSKSGPGIKQALYLDDNNQKRPEYTLTKEQTLCLIAGYSAALRMTIIQRWQELEMLGQPTALPQNYSEALRELADSHEENEQLKLKAAEDAPKVEFADTVQASDDVCQMAVACQVAKLPFGRNKLFQRLREKGVLISGGERHNMPKQRYIEQGLFSVSESRFDNPKTGEPIIKFSTHVSQKGIDWLIRHFRTEPQD